MERNNVTSKLKSQKLSSDFSDPNPEVMSSQTTDPNNTSKNHFRKYCNYCHKSNHSVSN